MKLIDFEIKNYRSCINTKVDLNAQITCLIGANGTGKTNILSAIQLLKKLKSSNKKIGSKVVNDFTNNNNCNINCTLEKENKIIKLNIELTIETDEKNQDEILDAILKFNFKNYNGNKKVIKFPVELFNITEKLDPKDYNKVLKYFYGFNNVPTSEEINLINQIKDFIYEISYYGASQFSDPAKSPISIEREDNRLFRFNRTNIHHEKFINDLYLSYENDTNIFNKYLSLVNEEGIGLINNIKFSKHDMPSNSYEVKSGGKIKKIERNRQLIIPFFISDTLELSPNQLSEGTFKTLALIFYIVTDTNKLLLIEEPEVCVHHGLLNSIMSLIINQSKTKQIIISTHSDFVLDRLEPENIIIVKKEKEKGTISKSLTKTLSKNEYKSLKSYLFNTGNLGEYWKEGGFENE